jgi:hypothetical protein
MMHLLAVCPSHLTSFHPYIQMAHMDRQVPKQSDAGFADKRRRQAAWNGACDAKQLSVQQRNDAASIFPRGMRLKVLSWPKL